ncbi:MAG: glycosyltransferase, partial [Chitinophagaceae bacterium]
EDPFPLVCLEAGSLGKPIICFEKGGGICELIAEGGGTVVPYLNIEELAKAILVYYTDRKKLKADGDFIKKKVLEYDVNKLAPLVFDVVDEQLNNAMISSL